MRDDIQRKRGGGRRIASGNRQDERGSREGWQEDIRQDTREGHARGGTRTTGTTREKAANELAREQQARHEKEGRKRAGKRTTDTTRERQRESRVRFGRRTTQTGHERERATRKSMARDPSSQETTSINHPSTENWGSRPKAVNAHVAFTSGLACASAYNGN